MVKSKISIHKSVLLRETIKNLNLKKGDVVIDATLGGGGHSREVLKKIGREGLLIVIDLDDQTIKNFTQNINPEKRFPKIQRKENIILVNDNFVNLKKILDTLKIKKVNAILADLGWSLDQLVGKGLSFQKDEKLNMRLGKNQELSAQEIVNKYSQESLEKIIKNYGEEKFWKNITKKIIEFRKRKKIETTSELAEIIQKAVPSKYRYGKINPATRTFQALRIEVNKELENLEKFILQAIYALKSQGRLAIISFHSLEDRIVKNEFRKNARGSIFTDEITGQKIVKVAPVIKIITKKPIIASQKEIHNNPHSRSGKLRICEKL